MLVLRYTDRPGVVGTVGGVLGAAGVNIGGMQVARAAEGGLAVGVLTLDQTVPARASSTSWSARSAPTPAAWSTLGRSPRRAPPPCADHATPSI